MLSISHNNNYLINYKYFYTLNTILSIYLSSKIFFTDINSFIYKNWNNEFTKVRIIGKLNFLLNTHLVNYSIYFVRFRLALSFLTMSLKNIRKPKILICGNPSLRLEFFNGIFLKKLNIHKIVQCFDHRFPGFLSNRYHSSYYLKYFDFYKHGFFDNLLMSSRKKAKNMLNHHLQFFKNPNFLLILPLSRDSSIGAASLSKKIPSLALSNSDSFNFGFSGITYTIPFPFKNIVGLEDNPLIIFFFCITDLIHRIHLKNLLDVGSKLKISSFIKQNFSSVYSRLDIVSFLHSKFNLFFGFFRHTNFLYLKFKEPTQLKYLKYLIQKLKSILFSYFSSFCLHIVWNNRGLLKSNSSQLIIFEKNNNLFFSFLKIINFFKLFRLDFLNVGILNKKQSENKYCNIFSVRKLKCFYSLKNYIFKQWFYTMLLHIKKKKKNDGNLNKEVLSKEDFKKKIIKFSTTTKKKKFKVYHKTKS